MKPVPLSWGTGFFDYYQLSIIFIQVTLLRHIKRRNYKQSGKMETFLLLLGRG